MSKVIRRSTINDIEAIDRLIKESFGDRYKFNILANIENRYLVYEIDDMVVTMTGLSENTDFKDGFEIDWTCTDKEHRRMGIMHELFTELLSNVKHKVYCSCWRVGTNEYPNLKSLMDAFGFRCVVESRLKSDFRYNCPVEDCVYQSKDCCCYEDLYIREI